MRIGITGAHGTGKTELALALSKELSLPIISEQARVVAKKYGINNISSVIDNKAMAREFQIAVLLSQLKNEKTLVEGFISDRTLLDCLAYWKFYGLDDDILSQKYSETCTTCRYDFIIYTPPENKLVDDGFRDTSETNRRKVDIIIRDILQHVGIPFIILKGGLKEKIAVVLKVIGGGGLRELA